MKQASTVALLCLLSGTRVYSLHDGVKATLVTATAYTLWHVYSVRQSHNQMRKEQRAHARMHEQIQELRNNVAGLTTRIEAAEDKNNAMQSKINELRRLLRPHFKKRHS